MDQGFPDLFGWIASHSLEQAGAPFIRYLTVDMDAEMKIELAVPVAGHVRADSGFTSTRFRPAATSRCCASAPATS